MSDHTLKLTACTLAGLLLFGSAFADPSEKSRHNPGGDNRDAGKSSSHSGHQDQKRKPKRVYYPVKDPRHNQVVFHFDDQRRGNVREYYRTEFRAGHCPPGLRKKGNNCLPRGITRKWQVGQPLPREVIFYTVPQPVVVQLGAPPSGHRYVRVAGDILLIALGTAMVVDAIQDIGGQ